jgi:hypothetical protein
MYHGGELADLLMGRFIAAVPDHGTCTLVSHAGGVMRIVVVAGKQGSIGATAAPPVHAAGSKAEGR